MGLLYVFPVSMDETGFAEKKDNKIILKTYGLPYIFWIYAFAIIIALIFLFIAGRGPVLKYIQIGDDLDALLGYSLLSFLGLLPVILLGFFFFEKRIIKEGPLITMEYRIFGLKAFSEKFTMAKDNALIVDTFLDSPNVARMKANEENLGFQNKGYFILWLITDNGKKIALDRHSRKADLLKLQDMLETN
jgi:hypothetical protein